MIDRVNVALEKLADDAPIVGAPIANGVYEGQNFDIIWPPMALAFVVRLENGPKVMIDFGASLPEIVASMAEEVGDADPDQAA